MVVAEHVKYKSMKKTLRSCEEAIKYNFTSFQHFGTLLEPSQLITG